MSYLADLLLVQLLALCSFGGPSPCATTKKRQHYSKSNNLKCGQEAKFTNQHVKFQHRANRICPVLQNTCCMLLYWLMRPPTNWTLYDCFYWRTSFRCTAVWFLLCDTFPVPKSTSTLYQSCRVGRTEGAAVHHCLLPSVMQTGHLKWTMQIILVLHPGYILYCTSLFKKRKRTGPIWFTGQNMLKCDWCM